MRQVWAGAATIAVLTVAAVPAAQAAPSSFTTGFGDDAFLSPDTGLRDLAFDRGRVVGAATVRIGFPWYAVAPATLAQGFDASDPADPGYRWATVDAAVRAASARGMRVVLTFTFAPAWAEGPGREPSAPRGAWKPDPAAYAAFLRAAAKRYSGAFPDPLAPGAVLPGVRLWQLWNEPNLRTYIAPQFTSSGPASPEIYRRLLNAGYDAVKSVSAKNLVITAGTAPYGDLGNSGRVPPARFVRDLLCVSSRLRPKRCPAPARFDVLAHHPYAIGGPKRRALNPDDVSVPDMAKLTLPLDIAVRAKHVRPAGRKRVWVTEIGWDSAPPDPRGLSQAVHARWLAESLHLLWKQGVDTVLWLLVVDQQPEPSFGATRQSGVFLADGTPKAAATRFQFPFVAAREGRRTELWGKAGARGAVAIQRRKGRRWVTVARARARGSGVFRTTISRRRGLYRARAGAATSPSYRGG